MASSKEKKLSKKEIYQLLAKNDHEDMELLVRLEDDLVALREKVVSKPEKNEPVVLLMSGGIDSVVAAEWLMCKYGVVVYPLVIMRQESGLGRRAKAAIDYFENYYREKYPEENPFYKSFIWY